jgi:hypothetical protein
MNDTIGNESAASKRKESLKNTRRKSNIVVLSSKAFENEQECLFFKTLNLLRQ